MYTEWRKAYDAYTILRIVVFQKKQTQKCIYWPVKCRKRRQTCLAQNQNIDHSVYFKMYGQMEMGGQISRKTNDHILDNQ